jgi:hypothetical protein
MATKVRWEVPAGMPRYYRRFEGWRSSRLRPCLWAAAVRHAAPPRYSPPGGNFPSHAATAR